MQKEVIISINGLHSLEDDDDNVEMIAPGKYYKKNDKQYIIYNEICEDSNEVNKNTIKINNDSVEIIRKGASNVHMIFDEKEKNVSYYNTPFGNILIGLNTNSLKINELDNEINIAIDYSVEVNYEHLSNCVMTMSIKSKEDANITLM